MTLLERFTRGGQRGGLPSSGRTLDDQKTGVARQGADDLALRRVKVSRNPEAPGWGRRPFCARDETLDDVGLNCQDLIGGQGPDVLRNVVAIEEWPRRGDDAAGDVLSELEAKTDAFVLEFQAGKGQAINQPGHEEVSAAAAEDVNQEKIVKGRR